MEDIYDDLNNYEDVHAFEELRAENNELKLKLEEHSAAMEKLQKDYDTLETEFKLLEKNYSSLLMTARAELQRKALTITQLNAEKDLMILNALKSGKNIRRKFNQVVNNPSRMKQDKPLKENDKTKQDNVKEKKVEFNPERLELLVKPTKVAGPDSGKSDTNNSSKAAGVELELSNNKKSNVNGNISQQKTEVNEHPKTSASNIKDRRKSFPAVSMPIDTFSSSDELERNYPTKDTRTNYERRNINIWPIERSSNKTSEAFSVNDKGHKLHEFSSEDIYKSRLSKQRNSSSYRDRDKYDVSLKYKKQYSPERGQKRPLRELPDDYSKQHMEHPDYYPEKRREHPDDYPKQHRDHPEDYPKQHRDYPDDYTKKHRDHPDDYPKHRDHPDDYSKQRRDYPDDFTKRNREHSNDYPKYRDHPDDYTKRNREHSDDYPKHRDYPDDYPKQPREHPDDYSKQRRDHPDDYPKQRRDHPDDFTKKNREHSDDYPKQHREHPDEFVKHEYGRYQGRSLESPPPQSYNRRQRTKSVHQSDHVRYTSGPEKYRYCRDDKYSAKYRSKDYDEPQVKRQRTESYGNPEPHTMDKKSHYRVNAHTPDFSPHEYDINSFSCQSPDSVHIEGAIAHPTKEILATASTPLDDPRVTSKRYIVRKENGKESLSAVVGSNINIIPVKKGDWNIKPVDVPVALLHKPSLCSDQLVKDLYMDIENPVTNIDASGEVHGTDKGFNEIRSKSKEIQHNTQNLKISKQASEDISKQPVNAETISKPNIVKNRIQKYGQKNKNTHSKIDVPIIELGETVPQHKNVNINGSAEELLIRKQQNNKPEDIIHNDKNHSNVEGRKKSKSRERGEHTQSTLTKMAIVADDLHLSDDNSDHMDTVKKMVPGKVSKICKLPLNDGRSNESVNNVDSKKVVINTNTDIKSIVDTTGIKNGAEEEKNKESNSKQKAKKKKSKSKRTSKDSAENTTDPVYVPEKKPKPKKEKESTPKETKEKFCDLFGDSSSLMTPEDLGIPSYLPISEDAQDAVDMKINQIIDAAPLVDKAEIPGEILTQKRVEVTIQETKAHEDIPKADLQKSNTVVEDNEAVHEFQTKASSKRNEEIIDSNQLPSPIIYENLNPGTDLNDPNVVKTVIISTGKQPEIAYESKIEVTKPDTVVQVNSIPNTKDINLLPATIDYKKDILKALATSTPQKEFSSLNTLEADAAKTDIICDPCISEAVATITNVEPVVNQTEKTTSESNDAPDVRIFVKRRRKVLKRPPMT